MDPPHDDPPPSASPTRLRRALPFTAAVAVLALAAPQGAAAVSTVAGSPSAPPPQGIYEGCAPSVGQACVERLATIRDAGFRYVLNYSSWYGSRDQVLAYADAAASLGLHLIWPLNQPSWRGPIGLSSTYPGLSGEHDLSNPEFVTMAIGLVEGHPASWGFYVGDEVGRPEAERVGALSATVRALAPGKPLVYVARPGAGRLAPFLPFVDLAGPDSYPVGSPDPPVWQAARSARALTAAAGVETVIVLQAFSWSQYVAGIAPQFPSVRRLVTMRDAAIRYGEPALILWYSFQDILRSDSPALRWSELTAAAFSPFGQGQAGPGVPAAAAGTGAVAGCDLLRRGCVPPSSPSTTHRRWERRRRG